VTDYLGPIHYIAIEFPGGEVPEDALRPLVEQLASGSIFLLDVEFASRHEDGSLTIVAPTEPGLQDLSLSALSGADAGLLDIDDLELLARDISVGSIAAIILYEDRTMIATIDAAERSGAAVVAQGTVDLSALDAVLDAELVPMEG
jgi:hypothetical protein